MTALSPRDELFAQAIATRVADLLRDAHSCDIGARSHRGLVDAATIASALGVSRDCVYAHAEELGGRRVGDRPRGRLRFDLDAALAAWSRRPEHHGLRDRRAMTTHENRRRGRRRRIVAADTRLLPVRGATHPRDAREERS